MIVKVTDPCYVIDTKAWDGICDAAASFMGDWSEIFDKLVTEYLQKKTGKGWATAGSTYYGDWSNNMFGNGKVVIKREFFADAGMWCVVPAEFNERDDMNATEGALLEFDEGPISVIELTNNNRQWAEIEVTGFVGSTLTSARSDPYRSDEEE